jgi:hypothetical protein
VESSGNNAEASFTLKPGASIPALVISSIEQRPGSTVHVEGRGFCTDPGCSTVMVIIDGQVGAADVKVNSGGTFSADAQVPAIKTSGKVTIVAVQTLADQTEIRAFGELEVTPRPNIQRNPQP